MATYSEVVLMEDIIQEQASQGLRIKEKKLAETDLGAENVSDILGLNRLAPIKRTKHTIDRTEIDEYIYEDVLSTMAPAMYERFYSQETEEDLATYKDLHQDLFQSLHKVKPELRHEDEIQSTHALNRQIMMTLNEGDEFNRLRKNCVGDEFNTVLGTSLVNQEVYAMVQAWKQDEEMNDMLNQLQEQMNAEQGLQQAQAIQQALAEQAQSNPNNEELGDMQAQAALNLEQAKAYYEEQKQAMQEKLDQVGQQPFDQLQRRIESACQQANQEIKENNELINAWGMDPGEGVRISIDNKREALQELRSNRKLKKMTELLGNLKTIAREEQKRKSNKKGQVVQTIELGNDIESLLPSEKMNLMHPTLKKDFYRRYNQKELMQYKKVTDKTKAKGPIICCVDVSGSMEGQEEIWSKSVAIAMLEIAQKQKRDFCCIHYDTHVSGVWHFNKNHYNPKDVVELAESFSGGGTNFQKPLKEALSWIEDSRYKKADIVFITDGDCYLDDDFTKQFNRKKEQKEFLCQGILIGSGRTGTLETFCDDITIIENIREIDKVADTEENRKIFASL